MLNSLLLIHDLMIGQQHQCLSRSLSLSVGFFIQDEAVDVTQSAPQELITMWTLLTYSLKWE